MLSATILPSILWVKIKWYILKEKKKTKKGIWLNFDFD